MRAIFTAVVLFAAALPALAELELPKEIKGEPGEPLRIVAQTPGKIVRYHPLDRGLFVFPSGELANPKNTVVWAIQPGTYRLLAYTALNGTPSEPVVVTVLIGKVQPDPKPKENGTKPEPKPDPTPGPGPEPRTELERGIFAAWEKDGRVQSLKTYELIEFWKLVKETADDRKFATTSHLYGFLSTVEGKMFGSSDLPNLRRAAWFYSQEFFTSDYVLTGLLRSEIQSKAGEIIRALEIVRDQP